ncbi:hypothetical protein GmHk_17G049166 [Glycine max]|nr:hypothetical protein GmHk_17G049166 [Glycine max]
MPQPSPQQESCFANQFVAVKCFIGEYYLIPLLPNGLGHCLPPAFPPSSPSPLIQYISML